MRTTRTIQARDADDALHRFTAQLSSSDLPGWIDVLDENGVLLRTLFYSS